MMWDLIRPEILQAGTDCRSTDESCPLVKFADDVGPNSARKFYRLGQTVETLMSRVL